MKKFSIASGLACLVVFSMITSCKKSSDNDSSSDPCNGVPAVTASGIAAPATDTLRLYASSISGASYSWTGPGGFTSNLQNPYRPNASSATNGAYKVKATVNSCVKESTVNLATFTFDTPPCSPPAMTHNVGSVNYTQSQTSLINFAGNGNDVEIYGLLTPNNGLLFTFNTLDMTPFDQTMEGVYRIVPAFPVKQGEVVLRVDEDPKVFWGVNGFVCVNNYKDNNQQNRISYIWCNIQLKEELGSAVSTTSGYAIY